MARAVTRIEEVMKDIRFGMLTTVTRQGALHSRPMHLAGFDPDEIALYFFSLLDATQCEEIVENDKVNVGFSDLEKREFLSISGEAELLDDLALKQKYWKPIMKLWFPMGVDNPDVALIKVTAKSAEIWDAPSYRIVRGLSMLKAYITGKPFRPEDHEEIRIAN